LETATVDLTGIGRKKNASPANNGDDRSPGSSQRCVFWTVRTE
jgi:hypothetical protein